MTQLTIIPDISTNASKIPKREGKVPHGDLLLYITSLVDLLMVAKESHV